MTSECVLDKKPPQFANRITGCISIMYGRKWDSCQHSLPLDVRRDHKKEFLRKAENNVDETLVSPNF